MSIDASAELVAERLRRSEYVEIIAHHDADGIAAGSIFAHALKRAGLRFRLRIRREIAADDLIHNQQYLLCDIGAGLEDLPKDAMVVDHHEALFHGEFHVNPLLSGIDGDRELSGSGTAYLVANRLGDNRDLAGLAMLGMIADGQALSGMNLAIFNDGVANGIITPARGLLLPGRDVAERLLTSIGPVIDGISGNEAAVKAIAPGDHGTDPAGLKKALSLCVLSVVRSGNAACAEAIHGDTFMLEREIIPDAHSLAAVIDACGKTGHGDLGMELCLRSSRDLPAAWEITRRHRLDVIEAFHSALRQGAVNGVYEVERCDIAGDVADALACRTAPGSLLAVVSRDGTVCRISVRGHEGSGDLGAAIRTLAKVCGGSGGGHRNRAGATIPCNQLEIFRQGFSEMVAA